jgi:hypothetical protein
MQILLGDSIFQQFFTEFKYLGNGTVANNTMQLSKTQYSLPTTYIGNEVLGEYVPVAPVTPEPNPEGGDPEPEDPVTPTDPTTTGLSTGAKIQISLGAVAGLLFLIVLIMCCMTCRQGNAYTTRDSTVRESEAQALIYQNDKIAQQL